MTGGLKGEINWEVAINIYTLLGFPGGSAGKESACTVGDLGSTPWVGKIPWRKERLPTPVFWPGEFHGLSRPWGSQRVGHNWAAFNFTFTV